MSVTMHVCSRQSKSFGLLRKTAEFHLVDTLISPGPLRTRWAASQTFRRSSAARCSVAGLLTWQDVHDGFKLGGKGESETGEDGYGSMGLALCI